MKASHIQLLPDNVIKQIAAAEVVQRPAMVVKELLENAIDAQSTTIKLAIVDGGKQLIQVIDNGIGMNEIDAVRCFERYATSKISSIEDLFAIKTLGFRGEALAAISSVAQIELITKIAQQEVGTRVTMQAGILKKKQSVAAPQGTQITVKNIFFNIPARRNFLKATATETKYIIEAFQQAAITRPDIHFKYSQNNKSLYNLPPTKPLQRIVHLFGENYQKHLIPCEEHTETVALSGYVGMPSYAKKTRGGQFLFVNNRYVKSPFIHHAVKKAFENLILPDTFPFYVLNLTVPPNTIDVHVHPMKTEVKFDDENLIYTLVSSAIKKSLAVNHVIPSIDFDTNINQDPLTFPQQPPAKPEIATQQDAHYTQFKNDLHTSSQPINPNPINNPQHNLTPIVKIESTAYYKETTTTHNEGEKTPKILPTHRFLTLHQTYILTPVKSGFLALDIKAAYERILYERYLQYLIQPDAVQKLLFPLTTTLSYPDFELLTSCKPLIEKLGFRLEMKPPNTVLFTAQPTDLKEQNLQNLIEELLEQYKTAHTLNPHKNKEEKWIQSLAKRLAHHKKCEQLTQEQMGILVDQLFACKNSNYTPDGKKIWYKISLDTFTQFLSEQIKEG